MYSVCVPFPYLTLDTLCFSMTARVTQENVFTVTHTIHIPVMEKADRLTGRTIQAVIGLAVSWLCPKHGVRGRLRWL